MDHRTRVPGPSSLSARRWARRRSERGAALLIVVVVFGMLVIIGLMVARSSRLAVATSGNERRMTQARYVAEYALLIAQSKLSNGFGESYVKAMSTIGDTCTAQALVVGKTCVKILAKDVQAEFTTTGSNFKVCDAPASGNPGSLGQANAQCNFAIELTDKTAGAIPAGSNIASSGVMGTQTLRYWYVTASATGWVQLTTGTTESAASAESATNQLLRARILAGPYF